MSLRIWGAGMVGLLGARMLKSQSPIIHEAQHQLPHNHDALLRFRDERIAEITGIPFRKVRVDKAIWDDGHLITESNLQLSNRYSLKTNGTARSRSIVNLTSTERWISPPDFISRLSEGLEIQYASPLTPEVIKDLKEPSISTIPMPMMMKMVEWPDMPRFDYQPIWASTAEILYPDCELYQTIYFPGPEPYYRVSLTGNKITVEFQEDPNDLLSHDMTLTPYLKKTIREILECFGIMQPHIQNVHLKEQRFGKLVPIDDIQRRSFIMALSEAYSIFSLGRFANWRPGLLLHQIPQDIEVIQGFLGQRDLYGRKLAMWKNRENL